MTDIPRLRIAVIADTGIGGTEKAATIYAVELAQRGYAVDYLAPVGPRSDFLVSNGVRLLDAARNPATLLAYLRTVRPEIIHQHVPGYRTKNPLYPALKEMGAPRPKVIETNVFGRLEDPSSETMVDFRCFISAASAAQALYRARRPVTEDFFERQSVLYYPVVAAPPVDSSERRRIRSDLEVREDEVLAVRIGRPGHKWTNWECKAFMRARRVNPKIRLLLMEPPDLIWTDVQNGRYGPGIILQRETRDFERLRRLYEASDLTIHASDWGESFGYTVAEAMAAGHPIITRSTPWGDNAQIELVESGVSGFVCWSTPEMGRRLALLASDTNLRRRMSNASRKRIAQLASASSEMDLLEEIIRFCRCGAAGKKMQARRREAFEFVQSFPRRERETSEASDGPTIDSTLATLYKLYRCARSDARALLDHLRRS